MVNREEKNDVLAFREGGGKHIAVLCLGSPYSLQ